MTPACLDCGCCCHASLATYVRVSGDDHARLGEAAETLTFFEGNRCYMRMQDGHCAALDHIQGQYVCRVYETRPQVCRDLERGSPACEAEIERKRAGLTALGRR